MFVMALSRIKIFLTLCLFIVREISPPPFFFSNHVKPPSPFSLLPYAFQTCESEKIELNKKHHCVQTHNPCRGSRFEKVESCFAPSGHKGVERFEPRLTQLAYFGERFREGNIRYNETFTDRPSFPACALVRFHGGYSDWNPSLQVVIIVRLRPCQSDMARYEKKNTSFSLFLYST